MMYTPSSFNKLENFGLTCFKANVSCRVSSVSSRSFTTAFLIYRYMQNHMKYRGTKIVLWLYILFQSVLIQCWFGSPLIPGHKLSSENTDAPPAFSTDLPSNMKRKNATYAVKWLINTALNAKNESCCSLTIFYTQ